MSVAFWFFYWFFFLLESMFLQPILFDFRCWFWTHFRQISEYRGILRDLEGLQFGNFDERIVSRQKDVQTILWPFFLVDFVQFAVSQGVKSRNNFPRDELSVRIELCVLRSFQGIVFSRCALIPVQIAIARQWIDFVGNPFVILTKLLFFQTFPFGICFVVDDFILSPTDGNTQKDKAKKKIFHFLEVDLDVK